MLNMTACIWKVCMESFTPLLMKNHVEQITVSVHKNFGYIQVRGKGKDLTQFYDKSPYTNKNLYEKYLKLQI